MFFDAPDVTAVPLEQYPFWFFFLLFALAMVVSSIGFKNYVWFISLGYGFSIAAAGVLMLILFRNGLTLGTIICCVIFFLYGCRLGGYLAYRELKSTSYKKNMVGEIKDGSKVPMGVKLAIWITCALLYATQVSPVFFRMWNFPAGIRDNVMVFVGAVVMVCGISLESAADIQKNKAKKVNPKRWVDTGLFRIVRCPNYLGEMIFWTGVLLSGIGGVTEWWQWVLCAIGYCGIIFVMFSGARRLEVRQNKRYGSDPEYQKFVKTVPILLPFVPLYSVEKYKWLVA